MHSIPVTVATIVPARQIIGIFGPTTAFLTTKLFHHFKYPLEFSLVFMIRKHIGLGSPARQIIGIFGPTTAFLTTKLLLHFEYPPELSLVFMIRKHIG